MNSGRLKTPKTDNLLTEAKEIYQLGLKVVNLKNTEWSTTLTGIHYSSPLVKSYSPECNSLVNTLSNLLSHSLLLEFDLFFSKIFP